MRSSWEKIKAFTLVEMLVVLTVAIIVMAVAAPMITKKAKKPPTAGGGSVPVGAIMIWGGQDKVPFGWIECDGRSIKEPRYGKLRSTLGGANHVPDMGMTYLMGISDEPPEEDRATQQQMREIMQQNPQAMLMFEMMNQNRKNSGKGYPKPILVRWIIRAEP